MNKNNFPIEESESFWKDKLSKDAFEILRKKGTERPFTGEYNIHFEEGTYNCGACNNPLFKSNQKFESDCGWPSFDDAIKDNVKLVLDKSHGMIRTETVCNNCGGHLGHLFNDGPTETGQRYCINSLSIDFQDKK
ncbi:MAG: peptide-methionine (R)-S-oxide reductase MsrB [Flavobacteriaceae bacterium]|nr:peptide-methionine (R)-S-oxide reductase MsrB [Flavobacteriaceae bacterium]